MSISGPKGPGGPRSLEGTPDIEEAAVAGKAQLKSSALVQKGMLSKAGDSFEKAQTPRLQGLLESRGKKENALELVGNKAGALAGKLAPGAAKGSIVEDKQRGVPGGTELDLGTNKLDLLAGKLELGRRLGAAINKLGDAEYKAEHGLRLTSADDKARFEVNLGGGDLEDEPELGAVGAKGAAGLESKERLALREPGAAGTEPSLDLHELAGAVGPESAVELGGRGDVAGDKASPKL